MLSGKQKGSLNKDKFDAWVATQSDGDFRQIIYRGKLNRREITKLSGISENSIKENSEIKSALLQLENELRKPNRNVLPPLANDTKKNKADENSPILHDQNTTRQKLDSKRVSVLEQENLELKARLKILEGNLDNLGRYQELSEVMIEMLEDANNEHDH